MRRPGRRRSAWSGPRPVPGPAGCTGSRPGRRPGGSRFRCGWCRRRRVCCPSSPPALAELGADGRRLEVGDVEREAVRVLTGLGLLLDDRGAVVVAGAADQQGGADHRRRTSRSEARRRASGTGRCNSLTSTPPWAHCLHSFYRLHRYVAGPDHPGTVTPSPCGRPAPARSTLTQRRRFRTSSSEAADTRSACPCSRCARSRTGTGGRAGCPRGAVRRGSAPLPHCRRPSRR